MKLMPHKSLTKTPIEAVRLVQRAHGMYAIDFGRAWFGTLRVCILAPANAAEVTVRLGEVLGPDGLIDRCPPGTVRFRELPLRLRKGRHRYDLVIPSDSRNTGRRTIKMPRDIGEVLPFRYAEIDGAPCELTADDVRLMAVHYPFDEDASDFESSDSDLNQIWDLSKHTMFATSFCGMFVDGDRERYPREADAYINQLGYYCVDAEYALARYTHEFMIRHTSVWTEWQFHSIFMAWADLMYTGDDTSVRRFYGDLQAKLLLPLAREDGLICTASDPLPEDLLRSIYRLEGEHIHSGTETILRDIVDWPSGEQDSYDFRDVNTVVNAFHHRALELMSALASQIGKASDAAFYRERADLVRRSFQRAFCDGGSGLYVDGEGSDHSSLHANMFPLAFDLVPSSQKELVLRLIEQKGMACSVYAAQYLLEALFQEGRADYAMKLMTAATDRSWKHMLDLGATMTFEAWDIKYKPNMDQNHAWGAAPANVLPRYVLGVQPLTPGADKVAIAPNPGSLHFVRGKVPTRHGPTLVDYTSTPGEKARLEVVIPTGMTAEVRFGAAPVQSVSAGKYEFTI
jgi:alpha-L-rhamnosidase